MGQGDIRKRICPLKETNVYYWVCLDECTWFKNKRCPIQKDIESEMKGE